MSNQQNKLECSWDADVIAFWNASLKSYKTCHEAKEQCVDPEKVTADLVKSLPPKVIPEPTNNKRKIDTVFEKQEQEILYEDQPIQEEEEQYEGIEQEYDELDHEEPSLKKARYDDEQQQQPPIPPMPPMPQNDDDDGLSNLIMAWYYAGYYTGLYQAGRQ